MLWSPSEVLAYFKEDASTQDSAQSEEIRFTSRDAFGGFETFPAPKEDFILIAENSEIHGPNPLFTIPLQKPEVDLNFLSTKILSADYQGLSNHKTVSLETAQLLMPDIAHDIHVAVIYFLLFDTEARGFIRPTCLAYFTSDKKKLISLAEPILNCLLKASHILQHNNILSCIQDLKDLLHCFKQKETSSVASKGSDQEDDEAPHCIKNQSVLQDIQDVLSIIENYQCDKGIEKQSIDIIERLKQNAVHPKVKIFASIATAIEKPQEVKIPTQNSHKKLMKNLSLVCGDSGIVLGLYHLYIMYKHFRRKYENIFLSENAAIDDDECLTFGACLVTSNWCEDNVTLYSTCALNVESVPKILTLEHEEYLNYLDASFEKVLLEYLIRCPKETLTELPSKEIPNRLPESAQNSLEQSNEYTSSTKSQHQDFKECNCRHVVPLHDMWDVIDSLKMNNIGIESMFLKILRLFDENQSLFYCVLSRSPIIILCTPLELSTAQNFLKALSVFIPRKRSEMLYVDISRQGRVKKADFERVAAVTICFQKHDNVEDFIPFELLTSVCILNLKDCSLTAPGYTGSLLADVNDRIRAVPANGPVFSVIYSILCDIERTVQWWKMVTSPSVDSSAARSAILAKGFSRMDTQIIKNLSNLAERGKFVEN